jgi:hypothetical protein
MKLSSSVGECAPLLVPDAAKGGFAAFAKHLDRAAGHALPGVEAKQRVDSGLQKSAARQPPHLLIATVVTDAGRLIATLS